MSSPIQRLWFQALETVSPTASARAAFAALTQVPTPPPKEVRDRTIVAGTEIEVRIDQRYTVGGQLWGGGRHVYLVHQWGGWHQQFGAHISALTNAGCQAIGYDAFGHGSTVYSPSGLRRASLSDLSHCLRHVVTAHGPAHGVLAHGTAAIAVLQAIRCGLTVDRLVLIDPVLTQSSVLNQHQQRLGYPPATATELAHMIANEAALQGKLGPETAAEWVSSPSTPRPALMIINSETTEAALRSQADELVAAWPEARVVSTSPSRLSEVARPGTDPLLYDGQVVFGAARHLVGQGK